MNGHSDLTDEQLVEAFRGGDENAGETLLFRYKNKVLSVARRFFLAGGDTEDLVQEGMCGLYSAMLSYHISGGGQGGFCGYAHACIKNRILDAVKKSYNVRNSALNESVPYLDDGEGGSGGDSPEDALIVSETAKEFAEAMKTKLSALEYKVMKMYIDGATMAEISAALGLTYKQTDNALVRAKNKLRGSVAG